MLLLLKLRNYYRITNDRLSIAYPYSSHIKIAKNVLVGFVTLGLTLSSSIATAHNFPYIEIETGKIRGLELVDSAGELSATYAFKGIPYAKPPVGELRWQPPQAAESWDGIKQTTEFGSSCVQPEDGIVVVPGPKSEDCLTLNVWTQAKKGDKRPVMVWIHGGGFSIGGSRQWVHNGKTFAESGAVLVNINYRLGPFGFYAHPALSAETLTNTSGNYGLMDQVAALRWVKHNIAAFGGDPDNVTIFGESAGGISVATLLVTPMAKGLFHRAIMQSGVTEIKTTLRSDSGLSPSGESLGIEIATKLGISNPASRDRSTAAALRSRSTADILEAADPRVGLLGKGNKLFPVIDGHVLPHTFEDAVALGENNKVPVIIGMNANEGTFYLQQIPTIDTLLEYRLFIHSIFEEDAPQVLDMFPVYRAIDVRPTIADIITVATFAAPARRTARLLSTYGNPVWMYHFTRVADTPKAKLLGATHGSEVFYVFKTMSWDVPDYSRDDIVSRAMHTTWLNFASSGNPNKVGLPIWPRYFPSVDWHLEFGDQFKVGAKLWSDASDMFDEFYYRN